MRWAPPPEREGVHWASLAGSLYIDDRLLPVLQGVDGGAAAWVVILTRDLHPSLSWADTSYMQHKIGMVDKTGHVTAFYWLRYKQGKRFVFAKKNLHYTLKNILHVLNN